MIEVGDRNICHTHAVVTQNYGNFMEVIFLYISLNVGKISVLFRLFFCIIIIIIMCCIRDEF